MTDRQTLRLLPGDRRDVVYFHDSRGMTFNQIAARLGGTAAEIRTVYKEEKKK